MDKNITYSFVAALEKILNNGTVVMTRGFEQIEILSQLLQIQSPQERVIVVPHRNNNIFALIAETMWVLGGRDDLAYLNHYLPRAIDFSDDGKTWRAAYGPRLRNWNGVDQFKEIARIISEDNNTKRAVMAIFDPQKDYVETKDVPCNNWLHFMSRDGKLHLNVTVRANDAVWGFGGINSFEWSILQEMMAFWTGNAVGQLSWFVGTLHVYKRHYKTAAKILNAFQHKTLYDFGIESPKFSTPFSQFDHELKRFFALEARMRMNHDPKLLYEIQQVPDLLLRNSLEILYIYNRYLKDAPKEEIVELVEQLPTNDFKISVIEYFTRAYAQENLINLTGKEIAFFDYYWSSSNSTHQASISEDVLVR